MSARSRYRLHARSKDVRNCVALKSDIHLSASGNACNSPVAGPEQRFASLFSIPLQELVELKTSFIRALSQSEGQNDREHRSPTLLILLNRPSRLDRPRILINSRSVDRGLEKTPIQPG
jgi:hypothetical protein